MGSVINSSSDTFRSVGKTLFFSHVQCASIFEGSVEIKRAVLEQALTDLRGDETTDESIPDSFIFVDFSGASFEVAVFCKILQFLKELVE